MTVLFASLGALCAGLFAGYFGAPYLPPNIMLFLPWAALACFILAFTWWGAGAVKRAVTRSGLNQALGRQ